MMRRPGARRTGGTVATGRVGRRVGMCRLTTVLIRLLMSGIAVTLLRVMVAQRTSAMMGNLGLHRSKRVNETCRGAAAADDSDWF